MTENAAKTIQYVSLERGMGGGVRQEERSDLGSGTATRRAFCYNKREAWRESDLRKRKARV